MREGIHSENLRRVAVKVYKMAKMKRLPGAVESMETETAVLRRLAHPNVVQLIDTMMVEEPKCKYYVVMEYISGPTIQKLVEAKLAAAHSSDDKSGLTPVQCKLCVNSCLVT